MPTATRSKRKAGKGRDVAVGRGQRQAKKRSPGMGLRNHPGKTEKGIHFHNTQDEKRRKSELSKCLLSPAPSASKDFLSPPKLDMDLISPRKLATSESASVSKEDQSSLSDKENECPMESISTSQRGNELAALRVSGRDTVSDKGKGKEFDSDGMWKEIEKEIENDIMKSQNEWEIIDDCDLLENAKSSTRGLEFIVPKKSIALPELLEGLPHSSYSGIDKGLVSSPLTFRLEETDKEIDKEVWLPLRRTCVIKEDELALSYDPGAQNVMDQDLYAGTSILDLATQWTFMEIDPDSSKKREWCPLPSITYHYIARMNYREGSDLEKIMRLCSSTANLFSYNVIDLLIHHNDHFSRVFIVHANKVINGAWENPDDDDAWPCILHADSLQSYHDTEKIAKKVRAFLNQYAKAKRSNSKGCFNKNSLPAHRLNVPYQQNSWSCGFHTLYARYSLMKLFAEKKRIEGDICSDDPMISNNYTKKYFSYNESHILRLRSDLLYLIKSLRKIKEYSNDKTKPLTFERCDSYRSTIDTDTDTDDIDEGSVKFMGIRLTMPLKTKKPSAKETTKVVEKQSIKALRKKSRQDLEDKIAKANNAVKFHGKLRNGTRPGKSEAIARVTLPPARVKGETAVSLRSYKDQAFRRALYKYTASSREFQGMLEYTSLRANRTMKKMSSINFIFDPIAEYPDREGDDFCPYRDDPVRIALCQTREELDFFIKDLNENKDKYIVADDSFKIDRLILGDQRKDLKSFLTKASRLQLSVQEMKENKEALSKTNRLELSPEHGAKNTSIDEESLGDDDFKQIFSD